MVDNIFSKIDSDRFGIKVGKVTDDFFSNTKIEQNIKDWKSEKYELILARIKLTNPLVINNLERIGFTLKDIQHTYYFKMDDIILDNLPLKNHLFKVREYEERDLERLVELSRLGFNNYGHYFADDRLNKKDCLDAYGDWAYNSCKNKNVADKIFVSEEIETGKVVGYLSFKNGVKADYNFSAGGMGAVDPIYRGCGIFKDIAMAGLNWGLLTKMDWQEHNTLINNIPVNRAFTSIGFKPSNHVVTLHGWIDEIKNKNYDKRN